MMEVSLSSTKVVPKLQASIEQIINNTWLVILRGTPITFYAKTQCVMFIRRAE